MKFAAPLIEGRLLRRYKRFLADVELPDDTHVTAHCPNTGSMLGCDTPGSPVWLSESQDPKRKYRHTWQLVEVRRGVRVGINTGLANGLVREALEAGTVGELRGYPVTRREVRFGRENSRVDLLLEEPERRPRCYVEVKNVTLSLEEGIGLFPDAVSARGTRHLRELMSVAAAGERAVLCFCVQRGDVREVRPADDIDPLYGRTLREAIAHGVEAIAYGAVVTPAAVCLRTPLPVVCP